MQFHAFFEVESCMIGAIAVSDKPSPVQRKIVSVEDGVEQSMREARSSSESSLQIDGMVDAVCKDRLLTGHMLVLSGNTSKSGEVR
jgi:hypothetical protein